MATGSHPCSEGTYLLGLCLEGAGQHVGEELDGHGQQELHEGHNDEHGEWDESKKISRRSHKLKSHPEIKF